MFLLNFVINEILFHCPSLKELGLTLLQRYRQTYGAIKTGQQQIKNSDTPENICESKKKKKARRAKKIKWSARYRVSKTPRQISHVEESCRKKHTHKRVRRQHYPRQLRWRAADVPREKQELIFQRLRPFQTWKKKKRRLKLYPEENLRKIRFNMTAKKKEKRSAEWLRRSWLLSLCMSS